MLKDLLFTLRTLRRQPAFTFAAVATLAVGIGATTAIFSTVNAALLRPLPYSHAEDLRMLGTNMTDGRPTTGKVAPMELARLLDPKLSVDKLAAGTGTFDVTLIGNDGNAVPVLAASAGEGFFDVFGLPMTAGRAFSHEETVGNGPPMVVLSFRLWRNLYGGDQSIVGQSIRALEFGGPITVVGVAAKDFDIPSGAALWSNLRIDLPANASGSLPGSQGHGLDGYVRLKPNTTPQRLTTELASVMSQLAREFPFVDAKRVYTSRTIVDAIVGDLGRMLLIILAAAVVLLILACANVTNLLLARAAVRSREIALRVALGASRGQIIRQLLTESLVLAASGAIAGLLLAYAAVRLLLRYGASTLPRLDSVPFDARVLLFVVGTLFVAGLLVGLAPALRLASTDIKSLMNEGGRSSTGGRAQHRMLATMIVVEIALAIVLVAGAGSLFRSFANQLRTDPGFVADGRLAVDVSVPFAKYNGPDKVAAWSRSVEDRLRAIAGVKSVASSPAFPFRQSRNILGVTYLAFAEQLDDPDHPRPVHQIPVSLGYFNTMGIKLVGGRDFTADDRQTTTRVAIVNRSFLRRYLTGRDLLNTRFAVGYPTIDPKSMMNIVGIVDDVKYGSLAEVVEPIYYTPQAQTPYWRQTIIVETSLPNPATIAPSVRSAMGAVDSQLPLTIDTLPTIVSFSLRLQRLAMSLMLIFAVSALGLAAIGIYGVIAYASAQRVGEVATRMALGATPRNVFWLMMQQGRNLSVLGIIAGLAGAYAAGRVVASQLYEVRASDPLILMSAVALVLGITFVAIVLPARRASRVNPARVLRLE